MTTSGIPARAQVIRIIFRDLAASIFLDADAHDQLVAVTARRMHDFDDDQVVQLPHHHPVHDTDFFDGHMSKTGVL
ncbi:MAG: hypothetical protein R6U10_06905 [Thermoplasmatota archaeon]